MQPIRPPTLRRDHPDSDAPAKQLLREHVRHCLAHSPFYRDRLDRSIAESFRGPADLTALPFTTKADLESHNERFLAVDPRDIVDTCQTSGTTGKPVRICMNEADLKRLRYNEQVALSLAGVLPDDRAMIACALGRCFMAGLAYFEGLRAIGANAIRAGAAPPDVLVETLRLHRPTVIIGVPSQLAMLADAAAEQGLDVADVGVRLLVCIGEPVRRKDLSATPLAESLQRRWGSELRGTYASTEMATSFNECSACAGGHVPVDLIVTEIVDEHDRPVAPGEVGELVVTPLRVSAMPLLRLRTGDMLRRHDEPCPCGRSTPRLGPVLGRKAMMLKYRGTTVFPGAIYEVLQDLAAVRAFYVEAFSDHPLSDRLRVVVSLAEGCTMTAGGIASRIQGRIRIRPEVLIRDHAQVHARIFTPTSRKPVLFFDHRTQASF